MNLTFTKLMSVGVALAFCLMGTAVWVSAQTWDNRTSQTGVFHAVDASTGEILYNFNLGTTSKSGPITYMLDGKQYVAQSVGSVPGCSVPDWGIEECRPAHDSLVMAFRR